MMDFKVKTGAWGVVFVVGVMLCGVGSAKPQAAGAEVAAGAGDQKVVAEAPVNLEKPTTAQDWLAVAEKKHANIKTLTAKVDWLRIQGLIGDEQRRLGTLKIDLGPPARFIVHFSELRFGKRVKKQNKWYIFDGKWLVEKIIDFDKDKKQFFKWQIVAPNAKNGAAKANPLAVGQGPFAVPVPVNREVINERFDVELIETPANDNAKLVQLRLKPKAKYKDSVKFLTMDIWYSMETLIPIKVRSIDDSENESIFKLIDAVAGGKIEKSEFDTKEPPNGQGWEVQITPWGK